MMIFRHGTYTGPAPKFKGKTALLRIKGYHLWAQFDDVKTGMGHGWYRFPSKLWTLDAPTDWDDDDTPS
jgi:hypothetical protein